jgi:hypothetical protein
VTATGGSSGASTGGSSGSNAGTGGNRGNGSTGGTSGGNGTGGQAAPSGSGGGKGMAASGGNSGSGTPGTDAAAGAPGTGGNSAEPAPSGGDTIEIDGKQLPKDKVVALIFIGTSNLAGRAQEPKNLQDYFIWYGKSVAGGRPDPAADPMPLPYDPRLFSFTLEGKLEPAREPTASDKSVDQGAGPGMGIMRAAAAKWPGYTFIAIGRGQSGERGGYCAHFVERNLITNEPWSTTPPTNNMDQAANRAYGFYNEVINQRAMKLKGKVKFGGIVTMFGATEERPGAAVPSLPVEPYLGQCLIKIAASYREALGDPDIPFIIGDFEHGAGAYSYDSPLGVKVRRQIRLAQMMTPKSDIIVTDGIEMRDDHHFTMAGHKTWGDRAIELIDKNGWAPWFQK